MNYIEVKLFCKEEDLELITLKLESYGIYGSVVEQQSTVDNFLNKKNEYDWDYVDESLLTLKDINTNLTFYLDDTAEGIDLLDNILQDLAELDIEKVEIKSLCDDEWKDNWKQHFKPIKATDYITIKPSWVEYNKGSEDEIVIEFDPGMAFGTGTHPTTYLTIKLLEKYINENRKRILDIGTGSGILSIVSAYLGAQEVLGIDIDPVAVKVAKQNVIDNNLESIIRIEERDIKKGLDYNADIILANLIAELVVELSGSISKNINKNGIFISSGILIEKEDYVRSSLEKNGFKVLEVLREDEWCAIAACLGNGNE
ncbi:MAG: 50S ribosomal protein L11 methyltransferase [Clostridiales bacterium]|nr:50S ribosomal protein L11 methyltransferase [Clostridiales bacterium]